MPRTMSAGAAYSSGLWLIPPRHGMKIIPAGAIRAMFMASWPAPLGIRWMRYAQPPAGGLDGRDDVGSIGTGVSDASVSTVTRVPSRSAIRLCRRRDRRGRFARGSPRRCRGRPPTAPPDRARRSERPGRTFRTPTVPTIRRSARFLASASTASTTWRCGDQGVPPLAHGGGARVRGDALDGDLQSDRGGNGLDDADRECPPARGRSTARYAPRRTPSARQAAGPPRAAARGPGPGRPGPGSSGVPAWSFTPRQASTVAMPLMTLLPMVWMPNRLDSSPRKTMSSSGVTEGSARLESHERRQGPPRSRRRRRSSRPPAPCRDASRSPRPAPRAPSPPAVR